ncbi:hypothetical protein FB451DRAFT_80744 [Mycena latifolia]|nr:hypothetical protein FB451DRAFT_80744 [Mycena latifolia]
MRIAKTDIELALLEKIVKITVQLADDGVESDETFGPESHSCFRLAEIYRFCGNLTRFDGWINLALSALVLARIPSNHLIFQPKSLHVDATSGDLGWVYDLLEHLQTSKAQQKWDEKTCSSIGDLLQVLFYANAPRIPTETGLRVIIRSLSMSDGVPRLLAFHILHRLITETEGFLHDRSLWKIMRAEAFWPLVGRLVRNSPDQLGDGYVEMGYTLSSISDWQPVIYHELASWIDVFYNQTSELQTKTGRDKFNLVLCRIWAADSTELHYEDMTVQTLVLVLTSLAHVWNGFNFRDADSIRSLVPLARCTVSIRSYYNGAKPDFQHIFQDLDTRLDEALGTVVHSAVNMITEDASFDLPQERRNFYETAATVLALIRHRFQDKPINGLAADVGKKLRKPIQEDLWRHIGKLEESQQAIELAS